MATDTKSLPFNKDEISRFSKSRGEPDWMHDLRLRALSDVEELPMPKAEKTRIKGWNFTEFQYDRPSEQPASLDEFPKSVRTLVGENEQAGNLLIHRNHTLAYSALSAELEQKGVIFTDLETALREYSDFMHQYLMNAVDVRENRLTALHTALMNGGTFLYVPKNVHVEIPLQTIHWKDDPEAGMINHVLIVADDQSSVTYVENYISDDENHSSVANIMAEVFVGENALVKFGAVDDFASGVTAYVNRRGHVARDGRIEWAIGQMNEGNALYDQTTDLIGDGSYGDVKSVTVGHGEQSQNFVTGVHQYGKGSEGYITTHGVMKDRAHAIFNGVSKVESGASKSHSLQTERVLMLSKQARGDANPILLIDEYDVEEASHAASVGRIDDVQMYYLMSRGISRKEAQRLIIHGFLAPVVNVLPIEGVQNQLKEVIERKVQ